MAAESIGTHTHDPEDEPECLWGRNMLEHMTLNTLLEAG